MLFQTCFRHDLLGKIIPKSQRIQGKPGWGRMIIYRSPQNNWSSWGGRAELGSQVETVLCHPGFGSFLRRRRGYNPPFVYDMPVLDCFYYVQKTSNTLIVFYSKIYDGVIKKYSRAQFNWSSKNSQSSNLEITQMTLFSGEKQLNFFPVPFLITLNREFAFGGGGGPRVLIFCFCLFITSSSLFFLGGGVTVCVGSVDMQLAIQLFERSISECKHENAVAMVQCGSGWMLSKPTLWVFQKVFFLFMTFPGALKLESTHSWKLSTTGPRVDLGISQCPFK